MLLGFLDQKSTGCHTGQAQRHELRGADGYNETVLGVDIKERKC